MHNPLPAEPVVQHRPKDECGVFAVYNHPNAAEITFFGLYALQHRGQESAGIVTAGSLDRKFKAHHGMGLVPQVFNERTLDKLPGTRAIGHVRYSTTGSSTLENAQPITVDCARGQIAIGHNGNLVNAHLLRDELEAEGKRFADEGPPEEAARAEYARIAERRVRLGLVLAAIGEEAGVQVTQEEMTQALMERVKQYPGEATQV